MDKDLVGNCHFRGTHISQGFVIYRIMVISIFRNSHHDHHLSFENPAIFSLLMIRLPLLLSQDYIAAIWTCIDFEKGILYIFTCSQSYKATKWCLIFGLQGLLQGHLSHHRCPSVYYPWSLGRSLNMFFLILDPVVYPSEVLSNHTCFFL